MNCVCGTVKERREGDAPVSFVLMFNIHYLFSENNCIGLVHIHVLYSVFILIYNLRKTENRASGCWKLYIGLFLTYCCLRPYHAENTGSRPITEVKQRRARLVLGWVTAWEYRVL